MGDVIDEDKSGKDPTDKLATYLDGASSGTVDRDEIDRLIDECRLPYHERMKRINKRLENREDPAVVKGINLAEAMVSVGADSDGRILLGDLSGELDIRGPLKPLREMQVDRQLTPSRQRLTALIGLVDSSIFVNINEGYETPQEGKKLLEKEENYITLLVASLTLYPQVIGEDPDAFIESYGYIWNQELIIPTAYAEPIVQSLEKLPRDNEEEWEVVRHLANNVKRSFREGPLQDWAQKVINEYDAFKEEMKQEEEKKQSEIEYAKTIRENFNKASNDFFHIYARQFRERSWKTSDVAISLVGCDLNTIISSVDALGEGSCGQGISGAIEILEAIQRDPEAVVAELKSAFEQSPESQDFIFLTKTEDGRSYSELVDEDRVAFLRRVVERQVLGASLGMLRAIVINDNGELQDTTVRTLGVRIMKVFGQGDASKIISNAIDGNEAQRLFRAGLADIIDEIEEIRDDAEETSENIRNRYVNLREQAHKRFRSILETRDLADRLY